MNIESAPLDRDIMDSDDSRTKFLTIGCGSYIVNFNMSNFGNEPHALIGRFCSIAGRVNFFVGGNHSYKNVSSFPFDSADIMNKNFDSIKPLSADCPNRLQIIIGHDVWIGHGVTVMGGVKIGNGAVIGANATVAKNIPPYAIAVGNPARVIKYRFDEQTIKKLLAIKWWNWSLKKIADNLPLMPDVEKFLAVYYSPELDNYPEDDLSRYLNKIIGDGVTVYQFIADFQAKKPLWKKVIHDFCQSDFKSSLLVIYISAEEDFNLLAAEAVGNAGKNILTINAGDKNFSPAALRKGTHFITTREMLTLEALDYLWDTDVKIISASDNNIFSK